ncbi:AAA family ATPase [Thioalkalivibrio nitratireducens]|nr:bifunctional aminoglycoside phosphotransferase/ATP-binding protein [Thioalkalivibrio nitratireducens]
MDPLERQRHMLEILSEPARFPHPADSVERIETHISTVLLAGEHAYKIKKPLNLGFLDFTDLRARRRYCLAELEINRVLAPGIYLDLAEIRGTPDSPAIGGEGPTLEYAVHMRRFDRDRQLDRLLDAGRLPVSAMDELARKVARFHESADRAEAFAEYGAPEQVLAPMLANFAALRPSATDRPERAERLRGLEAWTRETAARHEVLLRARRQQGFIRACHGDMHLGNMVYAQDDTGRERLAIFDAIEFSPSLRWIDVVSELAFLTMDLHARDAPAHAHQALNVYLEHRDDFGGLALLPFYQVYRALVRAKVHAIHAREDDLPEDERRHYDREVERYLALADHLRSPGRPALILMHGVSGSGKTRVSTEILQRLGAIRLRSDIERRRMIGVSEDVRPSAEQQAALYTPEGIRRVYEHLRRQADLLLGQGQTVIVDATFLTRAQRAPFEELARARGIPSAVVACQADAETLRRRLAARQRAARDASDAGIAVMERQLVEVEPPDSPEPTVVSSPEQELDWSGLKRLLGRNGAAAG